MRSGGKVFTLSAWLAYPVNLNGNQTSISTLPMGCEQQASI